MAQASQTRSASTARTTAALAIAAVGATILYWGWTPPREQGPFQPLAILSAGEETSQEGSERPRPQQPAAAGDPYGRAPSFQRTDPAPPAAEPTRQAPGPDRAVARPLPHERPVSDDSSPGGGPSRRVDAPDLTVEPEADSAGGVPASPEAVAGERIYVVGPGDTLGAIAQREYGSIQYADRIFEANRDTLASPHRLSVGQQLRLPPHED